MTVIYPLNSLVQEKHTPHIPAFPQLKFTILDVKNNPRAVIWNCLSLQIREIRNVLRAKISSEEIKPDKICNSSIPSPLYL